MPSEKPPRADGEAVTFGDATMQAPTITYAVDGCVLGHWQGIAIGVWARASSLELVAEQARVIELLSATRSKISTVHLVVAGAPLPGTEVREAYRQLLRRYAGRLGCSALLLTGDGFGASAVRAFLTGIQIFERRVQTKTFGHLDPLVEWLVPSHAAQTGERVEAHELRRALAYMLAQPQVQAQRGA